MVEWLRRTALTPAVATNLPAKISISFHDFIESLWLLSFTNISFKMLYFGQFWSLFVYVCVYMCMWLFDQ
jgi:hypothetical protein